MLYEVITHLWAHIPAAVVAFHQEAFHQEAFHQVGDLPEVDLRVADLPPAIPAVVNPEAALERHFPLLR